jgi:NAD(P)-dependent dehydrogenase (short-subunit alcohol dehydrogenase family)
MPVNQAMSSPRIILITGANSGVGLATTEVLTTTPATNFHVIMTGRSLSKLDQARTDLIARHPNKTDISSRLTTCQLDVLDDASIHSALTTISSRFGHLDALINNAAIGNSSDNVRDRFTACLETNVTGAAVVAERFRPLLLLCKTEAENETSRTASTSPRAPAASLAQAVITRLGPAPAAYHHHDHHPRHETQTPTTPARQR